MTIILDITRLLRRAGQSTPTGIDRVEMAYARHLLDNYPDDSMFVGRVRSRVWQLSGGMVRNFLAGVATRWELSNGLITRRELQTVERFLNCPTDALAPAVGPRLPRAALAGLLPSLQTIFSPLNLLPDFLHQRYPRGAIYLNVSHEGLVARREMDRLVNVLGMKPIYLIHDLIPLSHPEYVRPGDEEKHEARMRTVLGSAAATICNSVHTDTMLQEFASLNRLPLPHGVVSHLGVEERFHRADFVPLDCDPFFLMVGTIEPRKNHLLVLHAWRELLQRLGSKAPKLIIVGRRGWENENVIDIIERCRALGGHLLECNRLPDAQLAQLMISAKAVLFPSFAEGYGLPLAEALSLGVPVICSNLDVFRHIGGDTPTYLDPLDGIGWTNTVADYAGAESPLRQTQIDRLAQFQPPTWQEHFAVVDDLITQVGNAPRRLAG